MAQDAAQDACAIVHGKIRGLRNAEAFDVWLYRIVMRESTRVRRRFRTQRLVEDVHHPDVAHDPASIDIWRALAALPTELRDVTVLFYFDDLKTRDIARVVGVAHATVRTRLLRARERLQALLRDYDVADVDDTQRIGRYAY